MYIDKLFREPAADDLVAELPPRAKTVKFVGDKHVLTVAERACNTVAAADDMWESLAFASPQMRGIDERAEQFIASFRAEMEVQEMIASELRMENGSL